LPATVLDNPAHNQNQLNTTSDRPTMLIGSGLLAKAFAPDVSQRGDVCIYAAGVSNSSCIDAREFQRERQRLTDALAQSPQEATFVYFGTCSVGDPEARDTSYVQHKLAMEQLVSQRSLHLNIRLPQVAGKTPNPHTLLNYLYARISRSEAFLLYRSAKRNIIDVDDVVTITKQLLADAAFRNITLNLANPTSYSMMDIVHTMERIVGKKAIYEFVERGSDYPIDVAPIRSILDKAAVKFDGTYLDRVIGKYYG
jgi:nucleoside-diphosphate-sugar epimerase